MFAHGREAYRRNSFLVLYNFYKNIVYISVQYYFGFWSAFSGQPLYEPFIYQFYNITFTSLPIMYYALFDFEHEKEKPKYSPKRQFGEKETYYFLEHPHLYRIGIENTCFGISHFFSWISYGLFHAVFVFFTCLFFIDYPGQNAVGDYVIDSEENKSDWGKDLGLWVSGHTVFCCCIIVVNL